MQRVALSHTCIPKGGQQTEVLRLVCQALARGALLAALQPGIQVTGVIQRCMLIALFVPSFQRLLQGTLSVFLVQRFNSGHGTLVARRFDAITTGRCKFLTLDMIFCLRDAF